MLDENNWDDQMSYNLWDVQDAVEAAFVQAGGVFKDAFSDAVARLDVLNKTKPCYKRDNIKGERQQDETPHLHGPFVRKAARPEVLDKANPPIKEEKKRHQGGKEQHNT